MIWTSQEAHCLGQQTTEQELVLFSFFSGHGETDFGTSEVLRQP
jgi:hypothetical protein